MVGSASFEKSMSNSPPGEEVVITGISGRFPESNNVHEFRDNLFNKKDMVTDDDRRWKLQHPEIPKRIAKIRDINKLDAGYFGLHHRQADIMDPMMRKFLEIAIETIMDAGVNPSELEGSRTGVFVGTCYSEMEVETLNHISQPQKLGITGYLRSLIAHRVSYKLKLKGPSCILDTACSSSLNALEAAFRSIRKGKCDSALVGGVHLLLHPGLTRGFFRLGVLSTDGTCKVFDEKANGYVRGETIACVFLQKAKDAKRIYAQVVYSKTNSDGFKPLGITYPSTQMQKELMDEVLEESGIDASEISFIEAHGTGTVVGDPQEVEAIYCAVAKKRTKPLLIGSVKCSVGHTEPSSGLCSLAKVIIALETGYIAPNIHLHNIKEELKSIVEGRMKVVTELTKLDRDDAIIGINNFGFGGNNCHVLVRRFKKNKINKGLPEDDLPRLVCVSGRTEEALLFLEDLGKKPLDSEYVGLLHQIFKKDIVGHNYRGFTIVSKTGTIRTDLKRVPKERTSLHVFFGQWDSGCKVLGKVFKEFSPIKNTLRKINHILGKQVATDHENGVLGSFAVQIGIVEMLKLLELQPVAVYGDSLGKLVSAYYYEDITLEESVQAVCKLFEQPSGTNFETLFSELKKTDQARFRRYCINTKNRNDFLSYEDATSASPNSIILNISDRIINNKNSLTLIEDGDVTFLEVLGRLYEEGHNPQIHKLYPTVQYPVSRSTPMISPLIKWDNRKSWYTYKFGEVSVVDVTQQEHSLSVNLSDHQKYMTGHVIDGRNLIPAIEYLNLAWKTFLQRYNKSEIDNLPIVFENCRFIRAVTLPKDGGVKLLVSIQRSSGNFVIVENNSVVVGGRIFSPADIKPYQTDLPSYALDEEFLEQEEIYRELYLRGYNYSGLFKGIAKCNIDASAGLVSWENNWTTFIDKMLQLKILQMATRSLYVPVIIKKLTIDPLAHTLFAEQQKENLCPVYNYQKCNIIKSGGIELCGVQAASISKRKPPLSPVLEKYVFVPNSTQSVLAESVRVNTQIILENSLEINFKAVEILDDFTNANSELLLPLFCNALEDVPSVILNLTVSSKATLDPIPGVKVENFALFPTSNMLLIVVTKIFQRPNLLKQILSGLSSDGFLLTREEPNFIPESLKRLEILTEHVTNNEKLILLHQVEYSATEVIAVTSKNLEWLPQLQNALARESAIVVHSQNRGPEGIIGLVNCIRREPGGKRVRCFFTMDEAPKFDINSLFYKQQLKKQLAINIYKNKEWGSYRHLLLDDVQEVKSEHVFVNNAVKGDLSSLQWVEGFLSRETKLSKDSVLVYTHYSALNFKDIMVASGRVSIDIITKDRLMQETCLGIEFSGIDSRGRRLTGMTSNGAITSMLVADSIFSWQVPDSWTLEEAATVPVVYATVIYGLCWGIDLKPGMSILIHSATGGIGLAALNVCLHHGCDIFVTVGIQEKREYLREHYPQIPDCRIGSSRDTSFEEMIKTQTRGRGVDVVLNSLSEEILRASVRCMAPGGHFIEIGKFDLGNDAPLDLLLMEKNISYHGVMLDQIYIQSPKIKAWIFNKMTEGMKQGYIKPLPRTVFQRDEVVKAFKYMTLGKHIGKVLVQIRDENDKAKTKFNCIPRFVCDAEKSYIIVGGLGGFGLELADWLYLREVKKLVLVSRSNLQTGYQKQRIRHWQASGITVEVSTEDVTTTQGCRNLINQANKLGPVDAIFNLAVVLKDALFEDQTLETFRLSFAPKALATSNLDQITRECCPQLKYFVIFSSVSCGRGNAGQTNYGMANSIMERICEDRKRDGLPGLAIQWGAIGDVGLVAKMQKENKELVIGGTLQQKISSCLEVLDKFLKQDHPIVASMVVAEKNTKSYESGSAVDAVAYILGIKDIKTVSPNTSFAELGMDSMTGTEMLQILEKDFDIFMTTKEIRNLTFAKLIELQGEQKKDEPGVSKVEKGTQIMLKHVPREDADALPVMQIPSQVRENENDITAFVLPGIEGVFDSLETFTKQLKVRLVGLRYGIYSSRNFIEECAEKIAAHVEETVSKQGTFYIIGYSYGVTVAIELISILETKGYTGLFIAIDGSPRYTADALRANFPLDTESEFQTTLLFKIVAVVLPIEHLIEEKDALLKCETFDDRIELALSLVPLNIATQDVKKKTIIALHDRLKSVLDYKFIHDRIKSRVYLFKARFPMVTNIAEDYNLSEICEQPVQVTLVDGDHVSILNQSQLIDDVNNLLNVKF